MTRTIITTTITILLLCGSTTAQAQALLLQIGNKTLAADLADSREAIIKGLSSKTKLEYNTGMLFVFPFKDMHCMTMKDTSIPLSVAFLDDDMKIVGYTNMEPRSTVNYCASKQIKYAIEANSRWFNNIAPDTKVNILK